jgi:pimeloyl-ACP methyl ester carboxylesterase
MKRWSGCLLILFFCVLGVGGDGAAAPQVKTTAVNGTNLAYIEQGQGPTLVLVHGTLIDYRYWAAQMDPFAERYRVIAVSLRHHYPNPSTDDQSDYGLRVHAADVAALIRTLAGPPVHLVGHSYGGFIALLVARDHPGLVRSLVLDEPALLSGLITTAQDKAEAQPILEAMGTSFKATVAQLEAGNREGAIRTFLEVVLGPGTYERLPEAARGQLMDNVHTLKANLTSAPEPFTCEDAKTLGVPALLIGGDVSPRIFPLWMNGLQPCLRTVERVTIPRASHGVHLDNPADFNRAVLEFVGHH